MDYTATAQDTSHGFCLHRPAAWRETATAETNSYAAEVLSEANFARLVRFHRSACPLLQRAFYVKFQIFFSF
jgi:hypothetical protein